MSGRKFLIVVPVDEPDQRLMEIRAAEAWLDEHGPGIGSHPIFGEDPCYGRPVVSLADGGLRGLRIEDDGGYSNVSQTASLVQWLLAKPGAPSHVYFEWSCDDDEGYYGGSAYVTAARWVAHRTDHWFELMRAEVTAHNDRSHGGGPGPSGPIWLDDPRQFARLVATCAASGVFAYAQGEDGPWTDLLADLDLDAADVATLIDRATVRWAELKANPLNAAHYDAIGMALANTWEPGEDVDTDSLVREVIEAHYGRTSP